MKRIITSLMLAIVCISMYAQLPSVDLKTLDGKSINSSALSNDGKPFAICFFATWCKPCNRELKAISEVYPDWQDETGMKIFAVSTDNGQNIQKVKPLVDSEGWEYDILLDPNQALQKAMGIQFIPHTILVDGNGKIAWQHSGYTEGSEVEIIEQVRKLLAQ